MKKLILLNFIGLFSFLGAMDLDTHPPLILDDDGQLTEYLGPMPQQVYQPLVPELSPETLALLRRRPLAQVIRVNEEDPQVVPVYRDKK